MATTRQFPVHDRLLEGVDTTLPAHLIGQQWRVQHNMRLTPQLTQIPFKTTFGTNTPAVGEAETVMAVVIMPGGSSGFGTPVLFLQSKIVSWGGRPIVEGLPYQSGAYVRWSYFIYNGSIYYANDFTPVSYLDSGMNNNVLVPGGFGTQNPKARYIVSWYDHIVSAYGTRMNVSHLYNFSEWYPRITNEADFYDFVEWQQADYPFFGITGLGKIGGTLWVYTPTAIIPVRYVGLPKVFQIDEDRVQVRFGNTFPWTLVRMAQAHFFYDAVEHTFFLFDGQGPPQPIGEPIRGYIKANLSGNLDYAARMFGYVDVDNREVWWNFISNDSVPVGTGAPPFDKSVVYNYRYGKWYTASNENVHCFCGGTNPAFPVGDLTGQTIDQSGPVSTLGHASPGYARSFGTLNGQILREEAPSNTVDQFLPADDPVLESADYHYGDIFTVKECDLMVINATWTPAWTAIYLTDNQGNYILANGKRIIVGYKPYDGSNDGGRIELKVRGRTYLGETVVWSDSDIVGLWYPELPDSRLDFVTKSGRVVRYRFTCRHVRNLIFSAYSDGVRAKAPEL